VDAVVGEGRETVLIDRVPQAQLGGDAAVEPSEQGQAVAALRRGGEAEQLDGRDVPEERRGTTARPRGGTRRR
jgi:hypothetical protein